MRLVASALALCVLTAVVSACATNGPLLEVSPKAIVNADDELTLSWTSVEKPQLNDTVSIYLVTDERRYKIGFYLMSRVPTSLKGYGKVKLNLFHPRSYSFLFEYFSVAANKVVAITSLKAEDIEFATQVHLALTHDPTEMRINFVRHGLATSNAQTVVYYTKNKFPTTDSISRIIVATSPSDPMWNRIGEIVDGMIVVRQVLSLGSPGYTINEMYNAPANLTQNFYNPGEFHEVVLENLEPATAYQYRVSLTTPSSTETASKPSGNYTVVNKPRYLSKSYRFVSSPGVGPDIPANIFAFGDLGIGMPFNSDVEQQPPSVETVRNMRNVLDSQPDTPALVMHIGDISYARGYAFLWDVFMRQIEPVASQAPWMISLGNHEYDYPDMPWRPDFADYGNDSGGEGGIPSYRRFHMPPDYVPVPKTAKQLQWSKDLKPTGKFTPLPEDASLPPVTKPTPSPLVKASSVGERNIAYAIEYGNVHITFFSAEHPFLSDSEQYKFVEADLKAVDRKRTPFVILACHRPLYCSTNGCSLGPDAMYKRMDNILRDVYEPLMRKYKVQLGLWGHIHTYERSCAMKSPFECADSDNAAMDGAPIHVVIGMAGNVYNQNWQYYLPSNPAIAEKSKLHHQQPDWSVFRTMNFGYTHITTTPTTLKLRFLGNHRNLVHDEFEIHL